MLIVDELAALTAWTIDREAKRRIAAALGLLLSQGRAVGVVVIGAVQDPRKEVLTVPGSINRYVRQIPRSAASQ